MSEREAVVSRNAKEEKAVYFHPEQVRWLESMFPERVLPYTTTEAELREYFGTRKVLACIKERKKS